MRLISEVRQQAGHAKGLHNKSRQLAGFAFGVDGATVLAG